LLADRPAAITWNPGTLIARVRLQAVTASAISAFTAQANQAAPDCFLFFAVPVSFRS